MKDPFYLFYEEPDPDRWVSFDRYPRKYLRRIFRGPYRPGGVMRWFLNLKAGLDQIGHPYRLNDYRGLAKHPGATAHVIGKPEVISKIPPGHPIVFGPGVSAHPYDDAFWPDTEIRLVLLSCEWFRSMYARDLPRPIPTAVWPAGVDTTRWHPPAVAPKPKSILIYDKVRWQREIYDPTLIEPIRQHLHTQGYQVTYLRYGSYLEEDYQKALQTVESMIFLCEHETQGFAYLQALSSGVPILAWDRGGDWQDPAHYPHRVKFGPVSSVPYWDDSCGIKFATYDDFEAQFVNFQNAMDQFSPRSFVQNNFDLGACARNYISLVSPVQ